MKNIWLLLIITATAHCIFIGTIIYQLAKKPDYFLLKIVLCVSCIAYLIVYDLPCFKDLAAQETTVIVAEYIDFQSSNTRPGTRKLFFNHTGETVLLLTPIINRATAILIPGETYEIEYFYNSKVIKSYRLIE